MDKAMAPVEVKTLFPKKSHERVFFFFFFFPISFPMSTLSPPRNLVWHSRRNWYTGRDHQCICDRYYIWLHPTFCLWIQIWPLCKSFWIWWKVRLKFILFFWYVLCLWLKWELIGKFCSVTIKGSVFDHCTYNVLIEWNQTG